MNDEYRELTAEDLVALRIPFQRYCEECGCSFESFDPEDRICAGCARFSLFEDCPEALAEYDDEWPSLIGLQLLEPAPSIPAQTDELTADD